MLAKDGVPAADAGVTTLPLSSINFDIAGSVRDHLHDATVRKYARLCRRKRNPLPPISVVRDEHGNHWCYDGRHRGQGHREAGLTTIRCVVVAGTQDDAVRRALRANRSHGLGRSNLDKRRAVATAVEVWPTLSNRAIAKLCGVSYQSVNNWHPKSDNIVTPPEPEPAPVLTPEVSEVQQDKASSDGRAELIRNTVPMQQTATTRVPESHQKSPVPKPSPPFVDRFDDLCGQLIRFVQSYADHRGQNECRSHRQFQEQLSVARKTYFDWRAA